METYTVLYTKEDYEFTLKVIQIEGVSISLTVMNTEHPDMTEYWRVFITEFAKNIAESLLKQTTQITFRVSATGAYKASDTGNVTDSITVNSNWAAKLRRHNDDRDAKIEQNMMYIFDPDYYHREYQAHGGGSKIAELETLHQICLSFKNM